MNQNQPTARRSMPCNGKLISQLRKQVGWTQSELAARSGFTERLIAKAEASQNIAAATLSILAQTLTEGGATVSSIELSVDPATIAREFILSMYQRDTNVIDLNRGAFLRMSFSILLAIPTFSHLQVNTLESMPHEKRSTFSTLLSSHRKITRRSRTFNL